MSEVLTIVILFQFSGFRAFKYFYAFLQINHRRKDFPNILSYSRFVGVKRHFLVPLISFLSFHFASDSDTSYSTQVPSRFATTKEFTRTSVFKDLAAGAKRGKSTMGWLFRF